MRIVRSLIALAALLLAMLPAVALGVPGGAGSGMVDMTFGTRGEIQVGGSSTRAIATSSNGSYLVLDDDIGVRRVDANGRLDRTFGTDGVAPGSGGGTLPSLAALADGRFYVAAVRSPGPAIVIRRYRVDGSLDTTYADGGTSRITRAGSCGALTTSASVELRAVPTGALVLLVTIPFHTGDRYMWTVPTYGVVRVRPDGLVDAPFGSGGCTAPLSQLSLAVGPDGGAVIQENSKITSYDPAASVRWTSTAPEGRPAGTVIGVQPSGHTIVAGLAGLDRIDTNGGREYGWSKGRGATGAVTSRVDAAGGVVSATASSGGILVTRTAPDGTIDTAFGHGGEIVACASSSDRTADGARGLVLGDDRIGVLTSVRDSNRGGGTSILQLAGPRREAASPVPKLFEVSEGGWSDPFPHPGTVYLHAELGLEASSCGAARVASVRATWRGSEFVVDERRLPALESGRGPIVVTATDANGITGTREWDLVVDRHSPTVRLRRIAPRLFAFTVADDIAGPKRHASLRLPRSGCHTKSLVFRDQAGNGTTLDVRARGTSLLVVRRYVTPYVTYVDSTWRACRNRR